MKSRLSLLQALFLAGTASAPIAAADPEPPAMFGNTPARNMVSDAKNLPIEWDVRSGENILWKAKVGSQTYAGPVIHGGRVYVGTNNEGLRRPGIEGDKGVVIALDKATGSLLWQATHDKLGAGRVNDWPLQGVCSTPYVDDERVYYISNRATIVAADVDGFRDGKNDGMTEEKYSGGTRRRHRVGVRHDRRARRIPAQPGRRLAPGHRRPAVHGHRRRGRRGAYQPPLAGVADLHCARQEHR